MNSRLKLCNKIERRTAMLIALLPLVLCTATMLAKANDEEDSHASVIQQAVNATSDYEWQLRMLSFVSNRPDLSGPIGYENQITAQRHIAWYFESQSELRASNAKEMVFAWRDGNLLMRFKLNSRDIPKFLRGKRLFKGNPQKMLFALYNGEIESKDSKGNIAHYGFGFLHEFPFSRLAWWPLPGNIKPVQVYEGRYPQKDDLLDRPKNALFYIFVCSNNVLYVIGH
jgi:hypothetical protein